MTLANRDYYLGRYKTPRAGLSMIGLLANGSPTGAAPLVKSTRAGTDLTINELLSAYLRLGAEIQ